MPQPVDLPTEVARVAATERIQAIADRASLAGQQRQVTEADEQRIQSETQIHETTHTQSDGVDADGHRRNPFVGRRRHRKRKDGNDAREEARIFYNAEEEEEAFGEDTDEGHQFDVTI